MPTTPESYRQPTRDLARGMTRSRDVPLTHENINRAMEVLLNDPTLVAQVSEQSEMRDRNIDLEWRPGNPLYDQFWSAIDPQFGATEAELQDATQSGDEVGDQGHSSRDTDSPTTTPTPTTNQPSTDPVTRDIPQDSNLLDDLLPWILGAGYGAAGYGAYRLGRDRDGAATPTRDVPTTRKPAAPDDVIDAEWWETDDIAERIRRLGPNGAQRLLGAIRGTL